MSINVYASRGHSVGYGGNCEERSGTYGSKFPCESSCSNEDDPARSKYIDEVLARCHAQSAIVACKTPEGDCAPSGDLVRRAA